MNKPAEEALRKIMRMRELDPDKAQASASWLREQCGNALATLNQEDALALVLFLDSLRDTIEALGEQIETQGKAVGDFRRGALALENENAVLMRNVHELAYAKQTIEELAELNAQLFRLCEQKEGEGMKTRSALKKWKAKFTPGVNPSKTIVNYFDVTIDGYALRTFQSRTEAEAYQEELLRGLDLL